jgi:hypothetical protein
MLHAKTISFDLDDTLICYRAGVPQEPNHVPFFLRWYLDEPLRLGARELMRELVTKGHSVGVYTTSYRDPFKVKLWLWCYGIRVSFVITQKHYDDFLQRNPHTKRLSKDPRRFGIDWHVDNEDIVAQYGREYGFNVVWVTPDDLEWAGKVRQSVLQV